MAQFECEICGEGFDQKSKYERHMQTSHPARAPSAADLTSLLKGVELPKSKSELVAGAPKDADPQTLAVLKSLPDREYRDSAEIARALGELRSHQPKPADQPSRKGGRQASQSGSAASIAQLFAGARFPASEKELQDFAHPKANRDEWEIVRRFPKGKYRDMADVAKAVGQVKS